MFKFLTTKFVLQFPKLLRFTVLLVGIESYFSAPVLAQISEPRQEWVTFTEERVAKQCNDPCERDALIFVHGILGSKDTWLNKDTNAYWPDLLARDPDLNDIDIYRADYENYLLRAGPSMEEVLQSFSRGMQPIHRRKYRSIQFIAHSLGGLVVRRYLVHITNRYGHWELNRYRQVIMLGTPIDGSYFATISEYASQNQLLRVLTPIRENDFLQMMTVSVNDIIFKREQCPSLNFYVGYEKKALFLNKIVSPESATSSIMCPPPTDSDSDWRNCIRGFDRDHISLVKPADASDDVYKWVKMLIRLCADGMTCSQGLVDPSCGNRPF